MRVGILKPDHFGDLLLAAPAIAALRRRFTDLTLFCHPKTFALAEHLFPGIQARPVLFPAQDKDRTVDRNDFAAVRAALREAVDLLFCLRWERYIEELLCKLDIEYAAPAMVSNEIHAAVEHRWVVAPYTGHYNILSSYTYPGWPPPQKRPTEINRVALCVSAGFHLNAWPLNHWLELAKLLHDRGISILLVGGPAETTRLRILADALAVEIGYQPRILVGDQDFQSTVEALATLTDLVVATDSGTAHLAALARPVLSLFGGSPWRRFAPLGHFNAVLSRRAPCSPCYQFMRSVVNLCHTQECLANLLPHQVMTCLDAYLAGVDLAGGIQINGLWMAQAPWLDALAVAA